MDALCAQVPVLAVKRGVRGAVGAQGSERVEVPAFRVVAVDATGAGDTFDAGFLAAWLRGATLMQALVGGSAAAALGTTAYGGFDGQPDWNALLRLVEEQASDQYGALAALPPLA